MGQKSTHIRHIYDTHTSDYETRSKTIFQNLGWNPIEIVFKKENFCSRLRLSAEQRRAASVTRSLAVITQITKCGATGGN